ncbi:glycosyltransferase family 2 protein [candidate division KSB1 bacterium]
MDVSVVIPVYNEEQAVRETILEIIEELNKLKIKYEIIIVDDNSTDSSISKIVDLDIKILKHRVNLGGGKARVTGLKYADAPVVLQTDADGTYPCDKIPEILEEMKTADMVVGARKYEKAKGFRPLRIFVKWIIKKFASYLSGTDIPDLNTGFRAYRKDVALLYEYLYPPSHSIMSTMTLAFLIDNRNVKFVDIEYRERIGKSSFHPIRDTYNYVLATVRAITYFNPFKLTTQLTSIFGIITAVFLVRDIFFLRNIGDTTVLLFIVTLIVFLFGILFDHISNIRKDINLKMEALKNFYEKKTEKELIESDPNIEIVKK